jgi:hypothetical protein
MAIAVPFSLHELHMHMLHYVSPSLQASGQSVVIDIIIISVLLVMIMR